MSAAAPSLPEGWRLTEFETLDSTNDEAKRRAMSDQGREGLVVWAHVQSAGRGRQDRGWISPAGNLHCSVLLRPAATLETAATLTFVAALAAAEAVESVARDVAVSLKWPNDVLVGGRKAGGILLESATRLDGWLAWVVVGCGINLAHHPEDVTFPATSLAAATETEVAPAAMLEAVCARLADWYGRWKDDGFAAAREAWLARAHPPGTPLLVAIAEGRLEGTFRDLDPGGTLLLDGADGTEHRVAAGDVYFAER